MRVNWIFSLFVAALGLNLIGGHFAFSSTQVEAFGSVLKAIHDRHLALFPFEITYEMKAVMNSQGSGNGCTSLRHTVFDANRKLEITRSDIAVSFQNSTYLADLKGVGTDKISLLRTADSKGKLKSNPLLFACCISGHPDLPFWKLLENGNVKITRSAETSATTLSWNGRTWWRPHIENIESEMELVVDEGLARCLRFRVTWFEEDGVDKAEYDYSYENISEFPSKVTVKFQNSVVNSQFFYDKIKLEPYPTATKEQCYLSYYGLPEPPSHEEPHFQLGILWACVGGGLLVFVAAMAFTRLRRSAGF